MNKEKMLRWAEALESGKYKQCHGDWGKGNGLFGAADRGDGFCCLHVALEIEKEDYLKHRDAGNGGVETLAVVEKIYDLDSVGQFIEWNDGDLLSFPQIAVKIREMVAEEA